MQVGLISDYLKDMEDEARERHLQTSFLDLSANFKAERLTKVQPLGYLEVKERRDLDNPSSSSRLLKNRSGPPRLKKWRVNGQPDSEGLNKNGAREEPINPLSRFEARSV
jgi:hypothetical protein